MKRSHALACALAVVLAGCGGDSADTTVPPDPDEVVLSITSEGGFAPVQTSLDQVPRYLLTADRSLYFQGPVAAIFPGPLLPNIQVTTLSEANFNEVMELIADVGFPEFDERSNDDARNQVADATTEVFRYFDESGEHTYSVYALGLVPGGGADLILLNEIIQILDEDGMGGESRQYIGDRLQVIAGALIGITDRQLATRADWPLDVAFDDMDEWAVGQRCVVLEGDEAAAAFSLFGEANQAYLWGPDELTIRARPLLPGERGCVVPASLENMPPPTAPPVTVEEG